jgi:hypothetical protein
VVFQQYVLLLVLIWQGIQHQHDGAAGATAPMSSPVPVYQGVGHGLELTQFLAEPASGVCCLMLVMRQVLASCWLTRLVSMHHSWMFVCHHAVFLGTKAAVIVLFALKAVACC